MLRDRTLFGWHLRRADNGGFTLIEVAIAAFILMIAMVPVVDSMYGALSSASSDQALAGVSSIATEQLEKLTAVPYAQVGFYANVPGSSWQNQPAVDLGATGTSAIAPIATTTVQGTDVTIETFITWTNATVAASSGTSTTVDPDAYKQATVLVCWVPGSPHESLSSCTTSSSSVVQVAAGQQTVEQSTIIYPGGQGAYVGTTTSSSTTSTTTPIAPGAAGNVQASPASPGGNSQVNVTWSAPTSGGAATSYIVEWSTTPSFTSYAPSNPIGAPVTSDLVSGLSPSTTYYFLVIAYDYWVAGPASSQASATTQSSSTTTTSSATTTSVPGSTTTTGAGPTTTTSTTTAGTTTTTLGTTTTTVAPCTPVSVTLAAGGSQWNTKVYLGTGQTDKQMPGDLSLTVNLAGACNDTIEIEGDGPNSASLAAPLSPYALSNGSGFVWTGTVASSGSTSWSAGSYVFTVYENGVATSPPVSYTLLVCAHTGNPSGSPTQC